MEVGDIEVGSAVADEAAPALSEADPLRFRLTLLCLVVCMFLASLDTTIVVTSLPVIVGEFGQLDLMSWVVAAYLLTSSAVVPIYAKLSDIYGRRPLLLVAIALFALGSALCGAAQSMWWLIAARAVEGLGGGGLSQLVTTIMGDIVTPRERGKYQGLLGAVYAISAVVGPLAGGAFTDSISWRWCFFINLPVAAPIAVLVALYVDIQTPPVPRKLDVLGSALIVASTTLVLLYGFAVSSPSTTCFARGVTWGGQQYAWDSATILSLLATGAVALGLFVAAEYRAPEPIMPLRLFAIGNLSLMAILSVTTGLAMYSLMTLLPLYFQVVQNESAMESGLSTVPMMLSLAVAATLGGWVMAKTGRYAKLPLLGTAILCVGIGLLGLLTPSFSYVKLAALLVVQGAGIGLVMPNLVIIAQNSVDVRDMAVATAVVSFLRTLGGALGAAIYESLLVARLGVNLPPALRYLQNVSPAAIRDLGLPASTLAAFLNGYAQSLAQAFLWMLVPLGISVLLAVFVRHVALRTTLAAAPTVASSGGAPARRAGAVRQEVHPSFAGAVPLLW